VILGGFQEGNYDAQPDRSHHYLCLTSNPAFACVFHTDCKPGTTCVDGQCIGEPAGDADDSGDAHDKRATGKTWKTCAYDSDCSQGSRCIKGSGLEGVCLGH
jgi:hypothetical protein